jgi:hypothetical protein
LANYGKAAKHLSREGILTVNCARIALHATNNLLNRCLVPANSFAEYAPEPNPETKKDVV